MRTFAAPPPRRFTAFRRRSHRMRGVLKTIASASWQARIPQTDLSIPSRADTLPERPYSTPEGGRVYEGTSIAHARRRRKRVTIEDAAVWPPCSAGHNQLTFQVQMPAAADGATHDQNALRTSSGWRWYLCGSGCDEKLRHCCCLECDELIVGAGGRGQRGQRI